MKGVKDSSNPERLDRSLVGRNREQATSKGVTDSDNHSTLLAVGAGCDDMDTSETLAGIRERASVEEVMDSVVPNQSADKKCRLGDLHLAFVTFGYEGKD